MKGRRFLPLLAGMMTAFLLAADCLPTAAMELKTRDFMDVYGTGSVIGAEQGGAIPIVWQNCGQGNRTTYMRPVRLDSLKVVLKDLNIGEKDPNNQDDIRGLAFTIAQEAGHYWATGATGIHFRIYDTGAGLSLYVKKADDTDDLEENIFHPETPIGIDEWPETLTIQFNKADRDYEMDINGVKIMLPGDKIDANMSPSGKCYFTFGIYKELGGFGSLSVVDIDNTREPAPTESTAVPSVKTDGTTIKTTVASIDNGLSSAASDSQNTFSVWIPIVMAVTIVLIAAVAVILVGIKKRSNTR